MDALKDAVAAAFDKVVASGAIETAIEEQISKTIISAVKEQFSNYGDFNKAIKEKVATLVDVNLSTMDLPSYSDLVGKIIRERVGAVMKADFAVELEKDITELLTPAPAEITLEQLLEDYVSMKMDWSESLRGDRFTLIIEHAEAGSLTPGYKHIYIDENSGTSQYSCDIKIDVAPDGKIYGLKLSGDDVGKKLFVGRLYQFEKRIFQLYTAKSKLIVSNDADPSDFNTTFSKSGDGYDD